MHKIFTCLSCEAEFSIRHDMDDYHYKVEFCPFCGETLDEEETFEFDDEEDE
jgi:predicted RNA-binding Zn-ribbon protein involved in translation (DUF1610 family)